MLDVAIDVLRLLSNIHWRFDGIVSQAEQALFLLSAGS